MNKGMNEIVKEKDSGQARLRRASQNDKNKVATQQNIGNTQV